MTAAARRAAAARKLAVAALLVATVVGMHVRPQASAAAAAPTPATAVAPASRLPAEFSAIRPADLDGSVPPIPPSELWPAQ